MTRSKIKLEGSQFSQALSVLNKLEQAITTEDPQAVLRQIAGDARTVLKADLVDLYEFIQAGISLTADNGWGEASPPVSKDKIYVPRSDAPGRENMYGEESMTPRFISSASTMW